MFVLAYPLLLSCEELSLKSQSFDQRLFTILSQANAISAPIMIACLDCDQALSLETPDNISRSAAVDTGDITDFLL